MNEIDYSRYFWQNDKIRLRPTKMEDWRIKYFDRFDNEARFFLNSEIELPIDEQTAEELHKKYLGDGFDRNERIKLTIETLDGINVGEINLNSIDERNGTFSIGLRINREFRGKGYGTASMILLLNYAFNERRLHKFQGFVIEGNIASETMLIKLGCNKEGIIRGAIFHKGKYWNEIHYGLFVEEYNRKYKINKNNGYFA
jgi:RimJ/RimL family protein N-acetyltransferase